MDPKRSQAGIKLKLKRKWNGFGIHSESVGNQWGTHMELVWNWLANPMFPFGNVWGMHRGCWGRNGEFIRDYYELFEKQLIFVGAAGECIGNSSGILTNY